MPRPKLLLTACAVCWTFGVLGAEAPPPAKLSISGYGFFGNRKLKKLVQTIGESELKNQFLDANFVENCAIIIFSKLREDGFLRPALDVKLTLAEGVKTRVRWEDAIEPPLARPLRIAEVHFKVLKGRQYYFDTLEFSGLESRDEKDARSYFMETASLLSLKSTRVFTPDRLKRGIGSLTEVLERRGYQDAKVNAARVEQNDQTGAVNVSIAVNQGPKFIVRSVRVETFVTHTNFPVETYIIHTNRPYSRFWLQDFTQALKATNYHRGYPDTTAAVTITNREAEGLNVLMDLFARVITGPQIHVGAVKFLGERHTRRFVMANRVSVEPGGLLDPTEVEQGRARLARLGVFDSIQLRYNNVDEGTRDVVYDVKEGKSLIVNLLFGYGSYELLRGGVEIEKRNVFGLAHDARLRAIQSFKSSRGEFLYTMPELLGEDIDAFFNGFALRREEISFLREEYGGGFGALRHFQGISSDLSVRYNYQILNAAEADRSFTAEGVRNPTVGAIITDFRHDRRDSPVYPRRGYKIFTNFELASEYFGGDVNYQRFQLAGSYHVPLGGGRYLSLGLSHGAVATAGSRSEDLPFNKRFFPGGEYSIRGYQEGEAAPRNADGDIVGAETFLLGSIEFEQALTPKWSLVFFSDSIGFAHRLHDYPADESLFSVGGGIRWKTIVGPVRLEYGHNLNPRRHDPAGTLHFSLGFPF